MKPCTSVLKNSINCINTQGDVGGQMAVPVMEDLAVIVACKLGSQKCSVVTY